MQSHCLSGIWMKFYYIRLGHIIIKLWLNDTLTQLWSFSACKIIKIGAIWSKETQHIDTNMAIQCLQVMCSSVSH